VMSGDDYETLIDLIDTLSGQYSIDKNRLYATGQSMGCMNELGLSIKYPDLFAAMMLVAGQWDAQATSVLANKKMWILVAEGDTGAFPGMNASVAVWEAAGAKISKARWNARATAAENAANVRKMIGEGNIPDVLIRCDHHVERRHFRGIQKLAVFKLRRPTHFDDGADFVSGEDAAHTNRNVLVKQDAQRVGSWRKPESPE